MTNKHSRSDLSGRTFLKTPPVGAWTRTHAQVDTEAGPHGFDEHVALNELLDAQLAELS